jgi:Rrf2 family iron-sulfur cluster assembly transcriptional regulator
MKIDTKARVAIGAILDIAIHGTDRPVRMADISTRQGVSMSYLEHLFKMLVDGGFLAGVRGPGGGYRLKRRLALVSVADIIGAVDTAGQGQEARRAAVQHSEDEDATTAKLWNGLDDYLHDYLRTVSMESVLAGAVGAADWREPESVVVRMPQVLGDTRGKNRSQSSPWPLSAD